METLQIKKEDAIKAYDQAGSKSKSLLENLFGKTIFIKDVRDRIKTFEDAFNALGKTYEPEMKAINQIEILIEALNEGWEADFSDGNQRKYYIIWQYIAGSGFRLYDVHYGSANTYVGAPFVFKNAELAKYAATHQPFLEMYNKMLNPKSK